MDPEYDTGVPNIQYTPNTTRYPNVYLPAFEVSVIHRLRLLGRVWNQAYSLTVFPVNANDHINLVQPTHGWLVPIGFLFETDSLQRMAMVGHDMRANFPSLVQAFGALRTPRVIALAVGIYCIHVK